MGTRLYVGNLAYSTTEDGLKNAFGADGRKVASVFIVTDRETGRPRGFAFVEMGSEADAKAAIAAMDGQSLDGRALRVNEAQERSGGGGGGGGGRRSFGGDRPPPRTERVEREPRSFGDRGGGGGFDGGGGGGFDGGGGGRRGGDRDRDRERRDRDDDRGGRGRGRY
ncbi:MAG: RNA-binding protein [Myxococcota bacterium]